MMNFLMADLALLVTWFILLQMTLAITCACLIFLRVTTLLKNKKNWFYYLSAILQAGLGIADILLMFNPDILKSGMMILFSMNALLTTVIFYDIYKSPDGKRNLTGTPGPQTAHHQNYRPGKRNAG
jgi:hypothetical protein